MKLAVLILAVMIAGTARANSSGSGAGTSLTPHPLSVIMTVIPWLLKEKEHYYFVTVKAYGATTDQARTQALRTAVDQALGSVINSEREVRDRQLVRSEVVQYAAGYVDRYEVRQVQQEQGLVAMTMDVWVKRSQLSDRLLGNHNKPGYIDGSRLQAQAETLTHSRQQGDKLLQTVLTDFPHRAYDIEKGPSKVYYTDQRELRLVLTFKVTWRDAYVKSLLQTLDTVGHKRGDAKPCLTDYHVPHVMTQRLVEQCQHKGYVTVKQRPGRHGRSYTTGFDDEATMNMISQNLIHSRPAVLISLEDQQGRMVWRGCQRWKWLDIMHVGSYSNGDLFIEPKEERGIPHLEINGFQNKTGWALFNIAPANQAWNSNNEPITILPSADLGRVQMQVVRNSQCPNKQ